MLRIAMAFALMLGWSAATVGAADDNQEQKKGRFGGKFDPEKAKQFQDRFKNLDPEKLKEIQAKLKEKGIDIEQLKGKFDPAKFKELRDKFGKGGFKGKFEGKPNVDAETIQKIEAKLKEKGVDEETIKLIKEKLGVK